ncbi:hypothetical protein [Actinoplanes sp. NPDC026670]|uniref:hypothetical protein n=1 Tax=Actinoplanes sp. NPDC026670 TaxID=3154700 RepID=UPI0033FC5FD4
MTTTAEQDGAPGTIGYTIKYGKGYEDTWFNARGTVPQVRQMVIDTFGMKPEDVEGLTLSEIVTNATALAHAKGNLGKGLGGQVINTGHASRESAAPARSAPAQAQAEEPPSKGLIEALGKAETVDELKRLWAENQPLFSEPGVMDAYKARGAKLTGK